MKRCILCITGILLAAISLSGCKFFGFKDTRPPISGTVYITPQTKAGDPTAPLSIEAGTTLIAVITGFPPKAVPQYRWYYQENTGAASQALKAAAEICKVPASFKEGTVWVEVSHPAYSNHLTSSNIAGVLPSSKDIGVDL